MRRAPLVFVALVLMVGMLSAHYFPILTTTVWLILLSSGSLFGGTALFLHYSKPTIAIVGLWLFLLGLGGLMMRSHDPQFDFQHWTRHCPEKAYLTVTLKETPLPREKSYRAKTEVYSVNGRSCHGTLTLYLRKDNSVDTLRYGDQLMIHGYPDLRKKTLYTTSDHYIVTSHSRHSFRVRTEIIRMNILYRMQTGPLDRKYAGIAEAMTLGWRGDIDPAMSTIFRDSGIMHLLCVSGLHMGLLAAIVGGLFFWTGKERKGRIVRGLAQLIALWGFALLTGLAPSTLRAALMFSLFIVDNILARRTERMNILAAAAILMLTANPMLLFDVGWQLSFSAVGGILLARPVINLFRNIFIKSAAVSTAATVATLPIIVATFHRLPVYFLIANMIVVPAAGLILFLSLLYLAIPCAVTGWPLEGLLRLTEWLTKWVSSLPHAVVEDITLTPWAMAFLIAVVILLLAVPQRILRTA